MGHGVLSMFQVETKRFIWLMGVVFVVILAFQYFELPYGNVLSSIMGKSSLQTEDPLSKSSIVGNVTLFDGLNSTVIYEVHEMANDTETFEDEDADPNVIESEENVNSNKSVRLDYNNNSSVRNIEKENITLTSKGLGSSDAGFASTVPALSPMSLSPNVTSDNGKLEQLQSNPTPLSNVHEVQKEPEKPTSAVISIQEMNMFLRRSRTSHHSVKPQWPSAADQSLLYAKSEIENSPLVKNDPRLYAPLYRNVSMFKRSYELMEDTLKVYIYKEGEKPILHQPVLKGIYASEGWFMKLLQGNKKFVTNDPKMAHLFYLPFSSRMLEETLYVPNSHSHKNLIQYLNKYVDLIAAKYSFWNRTGGADHFLVACHDWAPSETRLRLANCIRALCNSDIKEGLIIGKDVSLPETNVRTPKNLLRDIGGKPASKRSVLAFYAGSMHGYLRQILLNEWGDDPNIKVFGKMHRDKSKMSYVQYMKSSKYCICPKGYEVNSPRVVEAIFFECVPVIISDNFVPPFFEIFNWEAFALFVPEKDIPNLKNILLSIPDKKFLQMQMRVKKVQQHFLWHAKPMKYDLFHMILHSIWYNRVFGT